MDLVEFFSTIHKDESCFIIVGIRDVGGLEQTSRVSVVKNLIYSRMHESFTIKGLQVWGQSHRKLCLWKIIISKLIKS